MKQHRIFIAVNFPKEIKEKLCNLTYQWLELPFRWVRCEDIHLTLVFIGNTDEEYLLKTINELKEVGESIEQFQIKLTKLTIAPSLKHPRYVWVEVEAKEQLKELYSVIIKKLRFAGIRLKKDRYSFSPHVTIGRLKSEARPLGLRQGLGTRVKGREINIEQTLNWSVSVDSFEIMESFLSRSGARYSILQSYKIGS